MKSPLQGITVVELGQNLAAPFCGQILGSLGADVVKIERPQGGDDCRGWGPPFPAGAGTAFHVMNPNKRSVALDIARAEDRRWLEDFIGSRDILVHNMRPGVMPKLGLDGPTLRQKFPRLIYAEISGFGAVGPLKDKPGYDAIAQAMAGLFHQNGDPGSPPSRIGPSVLDYGTGMWVAIGCLAALHERERTGQGTVIDGSLFETALCFLAPAMAMLDATGQAPARQRAGIGKVVLFEAFETADGEVLFAAANDRLFVKLVQAVGLPHLAEDARFLSNADRLQHKDALMALFRPLMKSRSTAQWLSVLEAAGLPCSAIHTLEQAARHPQTQAVGLAERMADSGVLLTRLPLRLDGVRPPIARHPPALGAHNDELGAPHQG